MVADDPLWRPAGQAVIGSTESLGWPVLRQEPPTMLVIKTAATAFAKLFFRTLLGPTFSASCCEPLLSTLTTLTLKRPGRSVKAFSGGEPHYSWPVHRWYNSEFILKPRRQVRWTLLLVFTVIFSVCYSFRSLLMFDEHFIW